MGAYDDIINLPHHVSDRHPQMPMVDRAAQFSPFAALTGYEAEVKEVARLTEKKVELTEEQQTALDEQLCQLEAALPQRPRLSIICFMPDARKEGGSYVTVNGRLKKLDRIQQCVVLTDGTVIRREDIVQIESDEWNM